MIFNLTQKFIPMDEYSETVPVENHFQCLLDGDVADVDDFEVVVVVQVVGKFVWICGVGAKNIMF